MSAHLFITAMSACNLCSGLDACPGYWQNPSKTVSIYFMVKLIELTFHLGKAGICACNHSEHEHPPKIQLPPRYGCLATGCTGFQSTVHFISPTILYSYICSGSQFRCRYSLHSSRWQQSTLRCKVLCSRI